MNKSYIRSTGFHVPSQIIKNSDLEKLMDTSDEWIQQRSGIKERRWVQPGDTTLGMAMAATNMALQKAGLNANDLDMIIFGALISDWIFPGTACLMQKELGIAKNIPSYDIRAQCSFWPYASQMADTFISSGKYNRILVVGSEIHSTSLDKSPSGRDIGVLFGDGAGAAIFERAPVGSPSYIIDTAIYSQGEGAPNLCVKKPSPNDHPRLHSGQEISRDFYGYMEGRLVFKNAVQRMCEVLVEVCKRNGFSPKDLDFVVAHQANMRINQMVLEQLGVPWEKTHHTIDRYGNTTAATIPITLNEAVELGKVKRGDLVATVAFGAGFTWGCSLLRY